MTPSEAALAEAQQFIEPAPVMRVVDRSDLEAFSECPSMAQFIRTGAVLNASAAMVSGDEAHGCLSRATRDYVDSRGALGVTDLVDTVLQDAAMSRPDVQPDVLSALSKGAVWPWAKFLTSLHYQNVLRFDGGSGDQSGQLAWDIPDLRVRVTSEVDLLHAGPAKEMLHGVDYKTGNGRWTAADVERSFQFACHSWLVLHNYPEIDCFAVRVWNTRTGGPTYAVEYRRSDLYNLDCRVRGAAEKFSRHCDTPPQECPTWPTVDKCEMCPAAALCPACGPLILDSMMHPFDVVDALVARESNVAALRKLAMAMVNETGHDIITPTGNAFGTGKPKATRKPTMSLYSSTAVQKDDTDENSST